MKLISLFKMNSPLKVTPWAVVLLLLSGCSSLMKMTSLNSSKGGESLGAHAEIESFRASEPELPEMVVKEFDDIPEDVQIYVQKWLNYFQGKGREHMERYLTRSTRYERLMKRILRENGVPEDIIYIALIESGFSPRAISRSRAVGYWQFIRGTGKRYGLAINTFVDERRDPVLATQAAADYFKGLYSEFNSWFLAMASYNVGEGRVRREINRVKSRDFWAIAKKRRLPKETINYVPKFLAARLIAKKPEAYGFKDLPYEPPIEFETARFDQSINMRALADKLNVDYAELKRLNPKFRGEVAPVSGKNLDLRLPLNTKDTALALAGEVGVKDLYFVPDQNETDVYKVRYGDSLLKIAKRFNTSVAHLREINDFKRRSRLRPGRTIFVPIPASPMPTKMVGESAIVKKMESSSLGTAMSSSSAINNSPRSSDVSALAQAGDGNNKATVGESKGGAEIASATKVQVKGAGAAEAATSTTSSGATTSANATYIVQEGESLAEISSKNNMTMEELMELNSFTEGQVISTGMHLKVKKIQPEAGEPSIDDLPSSGGKSVDTLASSSVTPAKKSKEGTATATVIDSPKSLPKVATTKVETPDSESLNTKANKELSAAPSLSTSASAMTTTPAPASAVAGMSSNDMDGILHKVQPGETLFKIAQQYNTTVSALKKMNKLRRRRVLRAGAVLKIPSSPDRKTSDSSFFRKGVVSPRT